MAVAPSTSAVDFKPHLFGKFYLLQRLAIGGMAEIFRARVPGAGGFEKELVVKRILPSRAQDKGFVKMLVNEAKLTVQLTHSNIAQVYECGRIDGTYFISMELVNGVSLKEMMQAFARAGQPISPEQAIFVVLQLLTGLDYAHRKTDAQGQPLQIVHCDVSPDNALVSFEGEVKLLDFGIARAATGLSNYKEGMLMGKLGYVAPEQASLERRWDHRVDIFAAGIILYELLTKQKPFPKSTDVESLVQSRKARPVPPTAIDPRLPKEVDTILARALAYDPEKRYPEARAFADALVDILFPTPQSSIQDLLGKQMKEVFADKIARQRSARAHDPLIMKVLANLAERQSKTEYERLSGQTSPVAAPISVGADTLDLALQEEPSRPTPPRAAPARPASRAGAAVPTAAVAFLLGAALGGAGVYYGQPYLRTGTLLVTSDPSGAGVTLDGVPTTLVTPAVIDGLMMSRRHEVVLEGAGLRTATVPLEPSAGKLLRRVHARLESALGSVTLRSTPSGAEVRFDDKVMGVTPLTLRGVRMDERHRVDLTLPGYEIDQFVLLPEKDGADVSRMLGRAEPRPTVDGKDGAGGR